jgi:hypothetical protein
MRVKKYLNMKKPLLCDSKLGSSSITIIRMIKSKRIRHAGMQNIWELGEIKTAYTVILEAPEGKRLLG